MTVTGQHMTVWYQSDSNANVPACDCIDWQRQHLPCKHLLVILFTLDGTAYLCRIKIFHNLAWTHSSLVSARLLHHHNQESDYGDDFTEQLQTSIAASVTESDSVSVSHTADTAATDQQAQSTDHLQSSVRQTLSTIINYTYLITDRNYEVTALTTTTAAAVSSPSRSCCKSAAFSQKSEAGKFATNKLMCGCRHLVSLNSSNIQCALPHNSRYTRILY